MEGLVKPRNLLFIMSDEHSRRVVGFYGDTMIRTPNLDRLAAGGARFTDAYCNSPICVPSRASFHTGRYPHQIRFWDNGLPYDGSVPSWAHRVRAAGHCVAGIGAPSGMIRRPLPVRKAALNLAKDAGRGDSDYQRYDDAITTAADEWLRAKAPRLEKPWVLFVSLVCPHFPLIARPEWYDLYPETEVPRPALYEQSERPDHPYVAALRECQVYDKGFDEQKLPRALAAYFGLVSFVDHNVGRLLATLAQTGLAADTRVIYTSDHG